MSAPADGERRLISAMTWVPGRANRSATGRGSGARAAAAAELAQGPAGELRREVGASSLGDLAQHRSAAGGGGGPWRGDGHAAPSPVGSGTQARAWRRARRSAAAPLGDGLRRQLDPLAQVSTLPATTSAAPALSATTSRRAPVLAALEDGPDDGRVGGAVAARERGGLGPRQSVPRPS